MQPISIIVPTLNEADNLPLLFERIDKSLTPQTIPYEIIVIDDHSNDGTAAIARQANAKYNVRLLMKQGKPGKAYSLLEGFKAAEHELVCMIDADLQYPPEAIKNMYHKLQFCEADIVVTERIDNKTSALRRLSSYTFNLLFTRLLFGIKYDTQSGLKLFRKSILKTMTLSPSPWTFDLEFLVRALEQGRVVVSQKIEFAERNAGVPKIHIVSATYELASGSIRLWRNASTKHVKLNYKQSELLQRSMVFIGAITIATLIAVTQSVGTSSALSLDKVLPIVTAPIEKTLAVVAPVSATPSDTTDKSTDKTLPITVQPTTSSPVITTPLNPTTPVTVPAPVSTSSTSPVVTTKPTTGNSATTGLQAAQPSNTAQSSSTTTSSSATGLPVSTVKSSTPSSRQLAIATPTSNSKLIATPSSTDSSTPYYPTTGLGSTRTQMLQNLAQRSIVIGAICVLIGAIGLLFKKLSGKIAHKPIGF